MKLITEQEIEEQANKHEQGFGLLAGSDFEEGARWAQEKIIKEISDKTDFSIKELFNSLFPLPGHTYTTAEFWQFAVLMSILQRNRGSLEILQSLVTLATIDKNEVVTKVVLEEMLKEYDRS